MKPSDPQPEQRDEVCHVIGCRQILWEGKAHIAHMMIDHLRQIVDEIAELSEEQQEKLAASLESDLREQQRIAAQLADPQATDLDYLLTEADREIANGQVYDLDEILDEDHHTVDDTILAGR